MRRLARIGAGFAIALGAAGAALAADVTLDGAAVPDAKATMSIDVPITEFREGGEQCPRLLPGCPKLEVCIAAPRAIAPLDAQLAGAAPARFSVGVEDGRVFARCIPASLDTKEEHRRKSYRYCLRCEGLTGP